MIKKIYNHYILFGKLVIRNPFYILSFVLGMIYLGLIIYAYSSTDISNPANMLQLSTYLVQGGMLIFMFLGYYSINTIYSNPLFDLYKNIPKATNIQLISHVIFVVFVNFFFCLFSLVLFLITYKIYGYPFSNLYTNSVYFIFIYWFIPFTISSLLGMFLGFSVKKKFSILFIIILWFFISPMNVYFLESFFSLIKIKHFPTFLRFGVEEPRMPYNAFAGFSFTRDAILIKLTWIIILSISIILYSVKNYNNKLIKTLIILVILSSSIPFTMLQNNEIPDREQNMNELKYYDTYDYNISNLDFNYKIKSYDITLDITDQLNASVAIDFLSPIEGKKGFSLYHGFKVKSIVNGNNETLNFKQRGDLFEVDISGVTEEIIIKYGGDSSVFMVANKNNIYLPFYFSWIPLNSYNQPTMRSINFSNHRLPNQPNERISYTLHYTGPQPLLTNLEKKNENLYKGTEKSGIYLLNGQLKSKKMGEYKLIYPITWENAINNTDGYFSTLEKSFNYINNVFKLGLNRPDSILYIPSSGPNDVLYSEYMWLHPDGLFILFDPYEFFPDDKFDSISYQSSYTLLGALLWKQKKIVYEDYNISTFFTLVTGKYINSRIDVDEPLGSESDYYLQDLFLNNKQFQDKHEREIINNVIGYIESSSQVEIEEFLFNWSKLLENPGVSWNELERLLDEVSK